MRDNEAGPELASWQSIHCINVEFLSLHDEKKVRMRPLNFIYGGIVSKTNARVHGTIARRREQDNIHWGEEE